MDNPLLTEEEIHEYTTLVESEDDLKWTQGEWILGKLGGVLPRFDEKERDSARKAFFQLLADNNRQSIDTIRLRYRVARAFPTPTRAMDKSWTFHMICSKTDNPQGWLDRALAEGWGQTDLETAIKASGGKLEQDTTHWLRAARVRFIAANECVVAFELPTALPLSPDGMYYLTLVERAAAQKHEEIPHVPA